MEPPLTKNDRGTVRVLHITTARVLYGGQRRQLEFEVRAARELDLAWETIALHVEEPRNAFERRIPRAFRSRVLLRVFGWITAIRLGRDYDVVLLRDMQLDVLGPILGLFVRHRITVHHAKEIEELSILRGGGWASRVAVFLEQFVKPLTMRSAWGLSGVTGEIRDYEVERFPWLRGRTMILPNGYLFSDAAQIDHRPEAGVLSFAFVCAEFAAWHGLDRLLPAIADGAVPEGTILRFHLVGSLSPEQNQMIEAISRDDVEIIRHGAVFPDQVAEVLVHCDVAIGSLALDRQGLQEGSTLKVREYLASGLPVYATHKDAALPDAFAYFHNDQQGVSLERMVAFAQAVKDAPRGEVRAASVPYLDKGEIMRTVMTQLAELLA